MSEPTPNGDNGRDAKGRFTAGNAGGPGNPHAHTVARFRRALLDAVTDEDFTAIAQKLVEQSKAGDIASIRELLNRTLGKPSEADVLERLERLESIIMATEGNQ